MRRKILGFDSNGIGWSIFHAMPGLSHNGEDTAIIYGFIQTLLAIQRDTLADTIVFAWDSRESKRRELFPEYKIKRQEKKKEASAKEKEQYKMMLRQFHKLRLEILPELGFNNIFMEKGYEGDDILASISINNPKATIKLVSRDNDLYQLINRNCSLYDWKNNVNNTEAWFFKEYGIAPELWADVKSMAGCSGDEVPGLAGIGPDTAIKYIKKQLKTTSKKYQTIANGGDVIDFTRKLVTIPFEGTPVFKLHQDDCTIEKYKYVCKEYGLKSLLSHGKILEFQNSFCYED